MLVGSKNERKHPWKHSPKKVLALGIALITGGKGDTSFSPIETARPIFCYKLQTYILKFFKKQSNVFLRNSISLKQNKTKHKSVPSETQVFSMLQNISCKTWSQLIPSLYSHFLQCDFADPPIKRNLFLRPSNHDCPCDLL